MSEELKDVVEVSVVPAGKAEGGSEVALLKAKLVQADLRAAAVKAGIVDPDGVKLIDMSTVQVNDAGEVVDAAAVLRALRLAKPWLFGASSSSSAVVPRAVVGEVKPAMAMSTEEWRAARAALLRRR